jgi:hypothetical protein
MEAFKDSATPEQVRLRELDMQNLRGVIAWGMEVDSFLHGHVGRRLADTAEERIANYRADLESVDPTDFKAVMAIQMEIKAIRNAFNWMKEIVDEGLEAQRLAQEQGSVD